MTTYGDAKRAVEAVHTAMTAHLEACATEAPPAVVIGLGEDLVHAVLEYERALREACGWSTPIRHLGPPLSPQDGERPDPARPVSDITSLVIAITHRVAVRDPVGFASRVQARYGDTNERGLLAAVRYVVESEMWRPSPQDGMDLLSTNVEAHTDDG